MPEKSKSNETKQGIKYQLAGGKPAGYLQAWPRNWTWDYQEQIQLAIRMGLKLWASELQVQLSNCSVTLPPLSTEPN